MPLNNCADLAQDLLGLPVQDVLAKEGIILLQFKALRVVAAALVCDVDVAAFRAAELDMHPVAFFSHAASSSFINAGRCCVGVGRQFAAVNYQSH
jgi:hypothetical protein